MPITGYNKVSNGYMPIIKRRTLLCWEEMALARWVTEEERANKRAVGRIDPHMVSDAIFTEGCGTEHAVIRLPLTGTR